MKDVLIVLMAIVFALLPIVDLIMVAIKDGAAGIVIMLTMMGVMTAAVLILDFLTGGN